MPDIPTIRGICHKAGHRSFSCPKRSDVGSSAASFVGPTARVLEPCWSCGERHYAKTCPVRLDRVKRGVCILCGSEEHWCRQCPRYPSTMGASSRPALATTATIWCIRCGVKDHCTAKCDQGGAPVHLPLEGQDGLPVCLWCGIRGHRYVECLRRVPTEVMELSSERSKSSAQTATNQK